MDKQEQFIKDFKELLLEPTTYRINDYYIDKVKVDGMFPEYLLLMRSIFGADNIEKFIKRALNALDNMEEIIQNEITKERVIDVEGIKKDIESNNFILQEIFGAINFKYKFTSIKILNFKNNFIKSNHYSIDDSIKDKCIELIRETRKLTKKLSDLVYRNSLFYDFFKIEYSSKAYTNGLKNIGVHIDKVIDVIKQLNKKNYIIDFLSDGKYEIQEMSLGISKCFYVLLMMVNPNVKTTLISKDDSKLDELNNAIIEYYKPYIEELNKYDFESNLNSILSLMDKGYKIKFTLNKPKHEVFNKSGSEVKLQRLVGLKSVKESIDKIKAYVLSNNDSKLNLHMAFYGNPGTGKTEVARIIGNILYENHILPSDKVVEVSRKDLVGKYVGETPYLTQRCIEKAMGGVLFIDEAYSLIPDDFSGDYGYEAVATLIKAMEDYRGKFCVILAGYKIPLNKMIDSNPGFKSRIQFHLNFDNFNRAELSIIAERMLQNEKYNCDSDALSRILDITDIERKDPNFANARSVRNIIQQVIMCQNLRTLDAKNKQIKIEDVEDYIKSQKLSIPTKGNGESKVLLSGMDELNELIGMDEVKRQVKKIRAYVKKNRNIDNFNMHMVFKGNPGTGKTEVARLISRILYEAGALDNSKIIETDAEGLIGNYVGQTATKTKDIINKAEGGVLFIDEAYNLVSDSNQNSFGQEAVATLLKEMEDKRGKFCVILAGYNKEMDELLKSNPGFDSRIQFHIDFKDYSDDELRLISKKMLEKSKYNIEEEALNKLIELMDYLRQKPNFANARTLRNAIDQVIMCQNLRTEDEIDDNNILCEDVLDYINDCGYDDFNKNTNSVTSLLNIKDELLNADYDTSNLSKIDVEQAIISIYGNEGQGTGFIVSPSGIAITCAHCLSEDVSTQNARIVINIPGQGKLPIVKKFKLLGIDKTNDIGVIKIDSEGFIFKYIPLASFKETYYQPLNNFIMAGYPFGGETFSELSYTKGNVASVNNFDGRKVVFADMFGKPGNSGSPIIDVNDRKVIGLFWGAITKGNEQINCFTPLDVIWQLLSK